MVKRWVSKLDLLFEQEQRRHKARSRARNQKSIDDARDRSAEITLRRDGRWFCSRCDGWHYDGEECPLSGEAIVQYVNHQLARARVTGALGPYRVDVLHQIAFNLNWWAGASEAKAEVRDSYLRHPVLGPFVRGEIKERDFWGDDKRKKLNPKTVSWERGGADYLLRDKSRKSEKPDGWFDHHARPSRQIVKEKEAAKSRRTVPRTVVPDGILQKLSHRQRVVYEMTVLSEPPRPIAEVAADLGIPDQSQISRIKRQAIEQVAKLMKVPARKSVK